MRLSIFASVLSILALATVASPGPATAAKSKMGCEVGTEVWDAAQGKCQPGTPKYQKKSADPAKKPAVTAAAKKPAAKKAPAAKTAPATK